MLTGESSVIIILYSVTRLDVYEDGFIATDEISARASSQFRQKMVLKGAFPKKAVYMSEQCLCVCMFIHTHIYIHTYSSVSVTLFYLL